jgi:enterochelin esterase-like enzyme
MCCCVCCSASLPSLPISGGAAAPFIVVQDGYNPKYHLTVPTVLDNLIAQKKLPVMIAVLVQHGGGDGPGSERGLEYDTVSDTYTQFIETEVLPRVSRDYKITFTKDPEGRATMGGSSGAACASTMAWFHPELYRKVLSYSGTFVNQARPSTELAPRLGISRSVSSQFGEEADSCLDAGRRIRQRRDPRRIHLRQLDHRQSAHGRSAEDEGLFLPVRVRRRCATH